MKTVFNYLKIRPHDHALDERTSLPRSIVWILLVLTIVPFVLNLLGIDFSSPVIERFNVELLATRKERRFFILSGSFIHVVLECIAATAAFLTVFLAFSHYKIKKDPIIPVIGTALLFSGILDFYHALTAARLIKVVVGPSELIPFTWVICRIFNSLICIIGISVILSSNNSNKLSDQKKANSILLGVAIVFALLMVYSIFYSLTAIELPQTRFPGEDIYRPYDIIPLIGFILSFIVFLILYKNRPGPFIHSLLIGTVPNILSQVHIFFGSTQLFDSHFNIAHYLKIIAYFVPFLGLVYEHILTFRKTDLLRKELEIKNQDLDDFVHAASHDLKEPLRGIKSNCTFLIEDQSDHQLDEKALQRINRISTLSQRMEQLLVRLLEYARLGQSKTSFEKINLQLIINDALDYLDERIREESVQVEVSKGMPTIRCHKEKAVEVFTNLISNSIKYNLQSPKKIKIRVEKSKVNPDDGQIYHDVICVNDNGIGIDPTQATRVFKIFKRLHQKDEFGGGSGAGLTIVKKIVDQHSGVIWIESELGQGSSFYFKLGGK